MTALILPRWKSLAATRWSVVVPRELQPVLIETGGWEASFGAGTTEFMARLLAMLAPHRPGDVVPVREEWRGDYSDGPAGRQPLIRLRADQSAFAPDGLWDWKHSHLTERADLIMRSLKDWQPADTMPDWAIRHAYRVDAVSAQWLPDIHLAQMVDEGGPLSWCCDGHLCDCRGATVDRDNGEAIADPLAVFRECWTADGHPWESWVWTYTGAFVPYQSEAKR